MCVVLHIQLNLYEEVTFGTKKKWPFKTGDLLKEGHKKIHLKCSMTGQEKGDLLIQVAV